jgi:mannose/fructose/sorbose-specific phosphotransferase system IIA component
LVGIVLVSHGNMAEGMIDAARMIVGEMEGVLAVSLQEMDAIEDLMGRIEAALSEVDNGEGALILVDAFGASPFNASARLAMQREKTEVVTGMNLPMLLELAVQREGQDLQAVTQIALEAGSTSIRTLSQTMKKN